MDYIDFQVKRIADDLQRAGVCISNNVATPVAAHEPQQESEFTIASGHKSMVYLPHWLRDHRNDPALTVSPYLPRYTPKAHTHACNEGFMDLLHAHLRERLFSGADEDGRVFIKDDTLYEHPLLTISYTTYQLKRERDPIHLKFGNPAVMVYSPTSQGVEPWLYARIVAVYHVFVCTVVNPEPVRVELLWVRWMERCSSQLRGANSYRFSRVSFTRCSGVPGEAFGFVDPSHLIRACHLIPAFDLGRTRDLLGLSIARDPEGDWCAFYANRYGPPMLFPKTCLPLTRPDLLTVTHLQDSQELGSAANEHKPPKSLR